MLNVTKTKYMLITTRPNTENIRPLSIDGVDIENVKVIKYLGIMVDERLCFNEHVDYTVRKAAQKFGVMCRVNRYLSCENKIMLYKAIIAPHFEYCPSILFLANRQQKRRMQIIQNKAMRLILGCDRMTSSIIMRNCLQWLSIEQRIKLCTLILVFKIKNGMVPDYLSENVRYGRDIHNYPTRRANDFRLPSFTKVSTQNSLFFKGFQIFNKLPDAMKSETHMARFKLACLETFNDPGLILER